MGQKRIAACNTVYFTVSLAPTLPGYPTKFPNLWSVNLSNDQRITAPLFSLVLAVDGSNLFNYA
ncbi:hypothetical protein FAZ15_14165 [Sphingobacterium olei]|uniref:Uncharacterized protein n=1 Tax=Sphingobacterium olei TaxID=2571155 RepID=A0A4U0NYS3_9SPHI|nr:hypothetical protein [Sphingobacterium olei]TJZ60026.1 hypothetical protein FAZ15_14165 [Sphingobacterium olei]